MKKKILYLTCAAAAAMMLTACGGNDSKDVEIDMEALASDLLETVTSDTLNQTSSDMLSSIYFYDGDTVDEALAYTSSGATSCEIAIVKSKDASNTSEIEKNFQTRVDNQAELYASYNAPEAERPGKRRGDRKCRHLHRIVCQRRSGCSQRSSERLRLLSFRNFDKKRSAGPLLFMANESQQKYTFVCAADS